jgi:hypothetical protein
MVIAFKQIFRRLTPVEMASRELAEAELQKLTAQSAQEYASSIVSYNVSRIGRLKAFITAQTKDEVAS